MAPRMRGAAWTAPSCGSCRKSANWRRPCAAAMRPSGQRSSPTSLPGWRRSPMPPASVSKRRSGANTATAAPAAEKRRVPATKLRNLDTKGNCKLKIGHCKLQIECGASSIGRFALEQFSIFNGQFSIFNSAMPTHPRFIYRCLAVMLLLALGVPTLSAQEGDKKKIPVAEIKMARIGFMSNDPADLRGRYKVGLWTPVYLKIKAGPQGIRPKGPNEPEPYIQVENEDNENVPTIFRTPFRMEPNEERWVMSYAKPANMSDIKIKVVIGDLEFRPIMAGHSSLDLHTHLYISLGFRIPDMQTALAVQAQRKQQNIGGQGQFVDTFPRYAGFESEANNLPEHWFGYHAVDALILSCKDKEFLLELGKD